MSKLGMFSQLLILPLEFPDSHLFFFLFLVQYLWTISKRLMPQAFRKLAKYGTFIDTHDYKTSVNVSLQSGFRLK